MCARMFPPVESDFPPKTPIAERLVYRALSKLPPDYVVFHSVSWGKSNPYTKHFSFFETDFLLMHPRYGLLIIEVKGGEIWFQDGVMYQKNTNDNTVKALTKGNDPLQQGVRAVKDCFVPLLEKQFPDIEAAIAINPCVWLPASSKNLLSQPMPVAYETCKGAILFGEALDSPEAAIKSVFKSYFADQKPGVGYDTFKAIQNLIAPTFDLIPSHSFAKLELDDAFLRLTNEQTSLLDYLGEQRTATIQGAAGTGKTVVATEKAKRLAEEGRLPLLLCYNRMLADYLSTLESLKGVKVINLSRFITEAFASKRIALPQATSEFELLMQLDPDDFEYTDVIIDEAQDFEEEVIEYFSDYAKQKDGAFYVFFDKHQLVLKTSLPKWIADSECRLVLSKNCRNTIEIAKTSFSIIDFNVNPKVGGVSSKKPKLLIAQSNPLAHLKKLIDWHTGAENGYSYDDITILTLTTIEKSFLKNTPSLFGIPISEEKKTGSVLFTTAKKFKGLESKVVIIIDVDEQSFANEEAKRVFYVACSRAMHRLSIFIQGDDEKIKSIASVISGPKFAPIGKIKNKTLTEAFDNENAG